MIEPQSISSNAEIMRVVDAARSVWTRRLVDHSRANPLLFYRDLKVGTLDLSAERDAVDRLLAGDALRVESLVSSPEDVEDSDPITHEQAAAEAEDAEDSDSVTREEPAAEAIRKTRRALVAIQRKALSNIEEKGIETLHLAMGMATWPPSDGGRPYDAPVLLLPARIESRGRMRDDLRLAVAGEPQINPVLLNVLEENFAVRFDVSAVLSECGGENESGQWRIDQESVFIRLGDAAKSVQGFDVKRRVVLANFQFAKMAMVEDLKRNGDAIASSSLVAAIAGHSASRQKLAQAVIDIEPRQLDDRPASDDYLVLDADATQHRAIVLIGKGQNGVVHGPPGTGKSQTIANVIAQSVAEGRRVLFVAEKRAALDAVIKRLSHADVGLAHLVLDLHGASVSRKEVMARIARTLEGIRHAIPPQGVETVHREFEARRRLLNEHARRVNMVRQPVGLSVNQIIGILLRLPVVAKSTFRLRGSMLAAMTVDRADEVKQWILDGAANPALLLGTDPSPWNKADITDGQRAQEAIDLARRVAFQLWPTFERLLGDVVCQLGIRPPETLNEVATILAMLRDLRAIRQQYGEAMFTAQPGEIAQTLGPVARGPIARLWAFLTNPAYRAARQRVLGLRTTPASCAMLRQEALQAEHALQQWRSLGAAPAVPVNLKSEEELAAVFASLDQATKALEDMTEGEPFGSMQLTEVASRLSSLAGDDRTPYLLPKVHAICSDLSAAGLTRFLDELREHNIPTDHWVARFEYIWLYSALEQVLASDSALASFKGRTHEQIIAEFTRLDRDRIRLASDRVRRLHGERAIDAMNQHFDEANLVQAEAAKKSRHIPLRELFVRAPNVLTRIAPCWVASPLSVSQLLDGSMRHFDIVVFDEASQILQEEAIPAIYRAEQVVVAGDRHQLPPTTFFATEVGGEDESGEGEEAGAALAKAVAAIGGFESLLGTMEAFLPNWLLEWHYRSEDERLIAFSNTHIYDRRLVTFPSARDHAAICHICVPHDPSLGAQEESSSREVDEVVRQVLGHAETHSHESLGVITMGIKHANRVQAALDRALDGRPDLSDFFSLDREERFFVKNLETVQGDERDAIILSIGYGKTPSGDLPHRFGPLTQEAGYRRLNVGITRAKRRICVISSFSHYDIDLNRSGSRGVRLLKAYLEYAGNGGTQLPEEEHAGEVGLNAFEADIRDALEAMGIKTRPQFGASRYRIDLVAMHPEKQGRPVLAIECDGASYHSSATARDRDRLRQAHLERLGWRFHRIWSTDWFYSREQEIQRAMSAYEEAVRRADLSDTDGPVTPPSGGTEPAGELPRQQLSQRRGPRPHVAACEAIDRYSDHELCRIADWITSDGLLRTDEELIRDIFNMLPFKRMGGRIRERLEAVAKVMRPHQ